MKFDADNLRTLLEDGVLRMEADPTAKEQMVSTIRTLPAEALKRTMCRLMIPGLLHCRFRRSC